MCYIKGEPFLQGYMQTVIATDRLIELVEKNKTEHQEIFAAAQEGYLKAVEAGLQKVVETFKETKKLDLSPVSHLVVPQNFVSEYDEALGMLKITEEKVITLDHDESRKLVLDKWNWNRNFYASNQMYVTGSMSASLSSKI